MTLSGHPNVNFGQISKIRQFKGGENDHAGGGGLTRSDQDGIISRKEVYTYMTSEAQKRAVAKYDAENTVKVVMKLNKKTDADILQRLADAPSEAGGKQGYIKALIRQDIQRGSHKD